MNNVLSEFFRKYAVDIACIQEHKFSGWDKLDKEYAIIDGLYSANLYLLTRQATTHSGPFLEAAMLG